MKTVHVNQDELHPSRVGYGILCWSKTLKSLNGFLILSLAGTVDILGVWSVSGDQARQLQQTRPFLT